MTGHLINTSSLGPCCCWRTTAVFTVTGGVWGAGDGGAAYLFLVRNNAITKRSATPSAVAVLTAQVKPVLSSE